MPNAVSSVRTVTNTRTVTTSTTATVAQFRGGHHDDHHNSWGHDSFRRPAPFPIYRPVPVPVYPAPVYGPVYPAPIYPAPVYPAPVYPAYPVYPAAPYVTGPGEVVGSLVGSLVDIFGR